MIERVDPYDHVAEPFAWTSRSSEKLLRSRLDELRARIAELDAQVAGLLQRRERLTRAAFEMAVGGSERETV
jgi:hypothetical protein